MFSRIISYINGADNESRVVFDGKIEKISFGKYDWYFFIPKDFYVGNGIDEKFILYLSHNNDRVMDSYLTIARGKHRKIEITPAEHLHFVLKFQKIGTLPPDIEGKDSSMKNKSPSL